MASITPPSATTSRSVVICCYTADRWPLLCDAVGSAARQLDGADELIVVVDHNAELLDRSESEFGSVATVVPSTGEPGLSGARNTGVDTASGAVVAFLDDDAAAEDGWLDALTAPFSTERVMGVGGAAAPIWEGGVAPWWMPAEYLWVVGCSYVGLPTSAAEIRNPIGCNMAFRRDAVVAVGGFSAALGRVGQRPVGGEETDVAIRIRQLSGGIVLYAPSAQVRHAVPSQRMTVGYFGRRCFAEGRSKAILAARVGTMSATEAERNYLATLLRGSVLRLGQIVKERSLRPIGQIGALAAGLVLAGLGFVSGSAQRYARQIRGSGRE